MEGKQKSSAAYPFSVFLSQPLSIISLANGHFRVSAYELSSSWNITTPVVGPALMFSNRYIAMERKKEVAELRKTLPEVQRAREEWPSKRSRTSGISSKNLRSPSALRTTLSPHGRVYSQLTILVASYVIKFYYNREKRSSIEPCPQ